MQSVEDPDRRANNPNPKWEVPIDVIEWQPSYTQEVCATTCPPPVSEKNLKEAVPTSYASFMPS